VKRGDFGAQAWKEQATNIVISKLHNDVSTCLHSMQIGHQNEYLTEDKLFSIDVAILGGVPSIALEVDGPFHFTANTHVPLGEPYFHSSQDLRHQSLRSIIVLLS